MRLCVVTHLFWWRSARWWPDFNNPSKRGVRSEVPLLSLLEPGLMQDVVQSLLQMYEQGGDIPRWPLASGYTGCMVRAAPCLSVWVVCLPGLSVCLGCLWRSH